MPKFLGKKAVSYLSIFTSTKQVTSSSPPDMTSSTGSLQQHETPIHKENSVFSVFRSITEGNSKRLSKLLGRRSALRLNDLNTPLLEAVKLGQEKCVASLLAAGADPNVTDEEGKTPLFLLMEQGGANPIILKELLKSGSSPNKTTWALEQTALHMAAKKGYQVCVKALVSAGGRADKKDSAGNTPLMYAAREGHSNVIRALVRHGASSNNRNLTNETAVHFAARGGHLECVNELLLSGASPNVRDSRGQTPLLLACKYSQSDVIQLLLDYHCDVNAQDTHTGKTALHWAVQNGDSA